jgi:hypothetical protein
MSYCSLEEAWGTKTICSRVENTKGKNKNVSYNIKNENHCNENNFMYNDLEDNYSLLPNNNNQNNPILDINTNNTVVNPNQELNINANDTSFFGYQNISYIDENNIEENNLNENNIEENNLNENDIEENDIKENNLKENDIEENNFNENDKNIEGFTNNNNIENFTATLDNIMTRLDAIEAKLSNSNNKQKNVHDIILYIIIGVFILFALDSIFKIGRLTV